MKNKVQGLIVCKNFKLTKCLGTGAFGQIYLAVNRSNQEQTYAAKLQQSNNKNPQLYYQSKIYKYLNSQGSDKGIPRIHAMTTQGQYNIMLMDHLGKSLEDLFVDQNKKFTLKTVLLIADQMLQRIQFIHSKQLLHRDIKPDNFLIGRGKRIDKIFLIDFGLSKKYIKDGKHIPYKDGKQLTGTARYASINTHIGIQQARRDDLQSIGYVLMYFLRGILPWQNLKGKDTKQKYQMIMEKKIATPTQVLCQGHPSQFVSYLNYVKNMKFEQKPDYIYLKRLFDDIRKKYNYELDGKFDWSQTKLKSINEIEKKTMQKNIERLKEKLDKKLQITKKDPNNEKIQLNKKQIESKQLKVDIIKNKYSNVFGNSNKMISAKTMVLTKNTNINQKVQLINNQKMIGPKISVIKQ